MAGSGGPSVQIVPAPKSGRVSAPDVFPNPLATTLSLTAPAALPQGVGLSTSAPWTKSQVRIDTTPNLTVLQLIAQVIPIGKILSDSTSTLASKYQIRIDPIPNLTLFTLLEPASRPFFPFAPPKLPEIPKTTSADYHFAIYQPAPNPAPTTGPALIFQSPYRKEQRIQDAAPPNTLIRGIPQPAVPIAINLDSSFSEPIKQKYNIYDVNYLHPNSQIPAIPVSASVITTIGNPYDSAFYYKNKGNVYDINYTSNQVPNLIPQGQQNPFLPLVDYYYMRKGQVSDTNTFLEFPANIPINILLPNVVNLTQFNALLAIIAAGFNGGVISQLSATGPFGIVISQNPIGGSFAPQNSTVFITVTTQGEIVPNVVNLTLTGAKTLIAGASLNTNVQMGLSSTVPAGLVISQSPVGGTLVAVGTSVTILVSQIFAGAGPILGNFSSGLIQGKFN